LDYDFLQKGHEPQNPHDVATLLKLYLRELPAPIIPVEQMPLFNNIDFTTSPPSVCSPKLREALCQIPLENYILLGTLCRHLSNLADYESCTKMNLSNLGLIFCPTLQIGSVLFKNLLGGGDGDDEERARRLKIVWEDMDRKQEELENLEMIKEFEMGLLVVEGEKTSGNSRDIMAPNTRNANVSSGLNISHGAPQPTFVSELDTSYDRGGDQNRHDDWEDVGQETLIGFDSPPPKPTGSTVTSYSKHAPYNSFGAHYRMTGHQREPGKMTTVQPSPDLYDELMCKEINEATSTPLIDFGGEEREASMPTMDERVEARRWRRHAREPAINRRSDSQPGHTRIPAGHY
ncbi:hypothetical protein BGZ94_005665, partial [Podila epigama]